MRYSTIRRIKTLQLLTDLSEKKNIDFGSSDRSVFSKEFTRRTPAQLVPTVKTLTLLKVRLSACYGTYTLNNNYSRWDKAILPKLVKSGANFEAWMPLFRLLSYHFRSYSLSSLWYKDLLLWTLLMNSKSPSLSSSSWQRSLEGVVSTKPTAWLFTLTLL